MNEGSPYRLIADMPTLSREQLVLLATQNRLFALIDPGFDQFRFEQTARLNFRDTDPSFYDLIAWDRVTYQAPRLVQVPIVSLPLFLDNLTTERWGVFVVAKIGLRDVAAHLQRFVITKGPEGNPYFLRFHDASVLSTLLQTWSKDSAAKFFGPLEGFGLPDLKSMEIRDYSSFLPSRSRKAVAPEGCLLELSAEQLIACGDAIENDLYQIIQWHLRGHHSRAVQYIPAPTLEARIGVAVEKARRYGLMTVPDIAGYAALMFELSPNFDEHPSFKKVLEDWRIPPEVKLKKLSQNITQEDWRQALELYDREFWPRALLRQSRRTSAR